ncbi:hypothetical protein HDU93_005028 [Gonapodya sp. JEL0774]|nr:hypothetical protein HDU93_005028 [Gonapodya sp. JEL0774]
MLGGNPIKFAANQQLKIGGDLHSWKTVVSIFALQQGVHEYIQGTVPKPPAAVPGSLTDAPTTTASASTMLSLSATPATLAAPVTTTHATPLARVSELDARLVKDRIGQVVLMAAIDESLLAAIQEHLPSDPVNYTSHLICKAILDTVRPNIASHTISVHRQLTKRELPPDETITTYLSEKGSLIRQLCNVQGREYNMSEVLKCVSAGLPAEYGLQVGLAEFRLEDGKLTVEDLQMMLVGREHQLAAEGGKADEIGSKAFSSMHNSPRSTRRTLGKVATGRREVVAVEVAVERVDGAAVAGRARAFIS